MSKNEESGQPSPTLEEERKAFYKKHGLTDLQHDILVHWQMFSHLSQYEIADDLNVNQSYVSRTIRNYGWLYEEEEN